MIQIKIKKLSDNAIIPFRASNGASGFDCFSIENVIIKSKETKLIKTGIALEIPDGFEAQIRPRSGLSLKTDLRVANSPGTIDSDYRGEIMVILSNYGNNDYEIKKGDRIAQIVFTPIIIPTFVYEELSPSQRGEKGFGSTGF